MTRSYLTPLFLGVPTKREAKLLRIQAYKPKAEGGYGLARHKLSLTQDTRGRWRVIRLVREWEVNADTDPAQWREHLREQTRRVERWRARRKR